MTMRIWVNLMQKRTLGFSLVMRLSGLGLYYMTPATSSTGLGLNHVSQQPCIPPNRDDWDHLFQPIFDEYFNHPTIVVSPVQEAAAPELKF
ncbi:hypothetical protein Tco_0077051 [Tanacetum coccineum]